MAERTGRSLCGCKEGGAYGDHCLLLKLGGGIAVFCAVILSNLADRRKIAAFWALILG
ncbi:hypothetical protein LBW89_03710 [Paenibacillus sp. alder61]|uniref:hypothetical protein n=1 Tax=Paenibacillus sp. alder61 TaxID=2862948 RepID=UPI001CD614D4|nr:hypothetical protein [Paenibacillus sp. alder61]MCA1292123.1 hypothetical protein [Paenibacillus sp. alder61]